MEAVGQMRGEGHVIGAVHHLAMGNHIAAGCNMRAALDAGVGTEQLRQALVGYDRPMADHQLLDRIIGTHQGMEQAKRIAPPAYDVQGPGPMA